MNNSLLISDHLTDYHFMNDLFPFYILLNDELEILSLGKSISKAYNVSIGEKFSEHFDINRPIGVKDYNSLLKYKAALFIVNCLKIDNQKLRGQMYFDEKTRICCFLGTPLVNSFDSLTPLGLNLNDFAIHDSISQFLFSLQMNLTSIKDSKQIADKLQQSNAQLQETNTRLKEINESLDVFIYKLTHDLRVPAINIVSMLKLLERKSNFSEETIDMGQKFYKHAFESALKLIQTIDDFIMLSKIEKARDRKPVVCNITEILKEIKEDLNHTIIKKDVKIEQIIKDETVIFVPDDLKSIFQNLITNAIKYQPEDNQPIIKIHAKKEGNILRVDFEDNGLGINLQAHEHKLFQVFSRLNTNHKIKGTGIGLYLVKKLLTKNNGTIAIESALGKGSTFTIYLQTNSNEY